MIIAPAVNRIYTFLIKYRQSLAYPASDQQSSIFSMISAIIPARLKGTIK